MTSDLVSISGLFVMLGLGIRHALDPDHVATVDGMTFGLLDASPKVAPWVGALFALGHGLVITAIAMGVGLLSARFTLPAQWVAWIEWSPVALLLLVGVLNTKALLNTSEPYRPVGVKAGFVPAALRQGASPWAIFGVGVAFALVLDTAAQAAAWGLAASASGGVWGAFAVGMAFTLGMVISAALYGQIMCRALLAAAQGPQAARLRRAIGWFTVVFAFGVAFYMIGSHFMPALAIDEERFALLGVPGVAALALVWAGVALWKKLPRRAPQTAAAPATPSAVATAGAGRSPRVPYVSAPTLSLRG